MFCNELLSNTRDNVFLNELLNFESAVSLDSEDIPCLLNTNSLVSGSIIASLV